VQIQRWPIGRVHVRRTSPAVPQRVSTAAVTHARDVADENLARTETMPDRAVRRGQRDPASAVVLDEVADHGLTVARRGNEVRDGNRLGIACVLSSVRPVPTLPGTGSSRP
jgi:hypothetical protein